MTINEIAKMAGVSNAAVSRYLNGGSLSEEKRQRIHTIVEETGYQPDTYAQMLRTKKVRQIGVIVPKISSNAVSQVMAGVTAVLNRENYVTLLANAEGNEKKELDYLSIFRANRVAGVLLVATEITPQHEDIISSMKIPVVIIGQKHRKIPCVYHNDYDASREVFDLIFQSGRRHVAYIGATERDVAVGQMRKKAFYDTVDSYHVSRSSCPFIYSDFTREGGYQSAHRLIETHPELDGIACVTDNTAIGAIQAVRESGKSVPDDIAVSGIGDSWICEAVTPQLTSVHYYYEESGVEAANMLISMLESAGDDRPVRQTILGYKLMKRHSI